MFTLSDDTLITAEVEGTFRQLVVIIRQREIVDTYNLASPQGCHAAVESAHQTDQCQFRGIYV